MVISRYLEIVKILTLCCCWYASSSSNNIIGKTLLSDFPYPMTITMVQLLSVSIYSGPLLRAWNVKKCKLDNMVYITLIFPLSVGKFCASAIAHMSILKVSLSYAHTVKATLPLFTVILSRLLLGEKHTTAVYVSLMPIIGGVAVSSMTEISFDVIGLCSALAATIILTIQNIYSKKCMKDTGIHQFHLLMILARIATLLFIPIWLIFDFRSFFHDNDSLKHTTSLRLIVLLILDGACNFLQHIFAFSILALVTPLTYSVANTTKRIVIITSSLILLKNPVSVSNVLGMCMAVVGVMYYNKVKYEENKAAMRATVLPHTHSDLDNKHNLLLTSINNDWQMKNGSHRLLNGYHQNHNIQGDTPTELSNRTAYNDDTTNRASFHV